MCIKFRVASVCGLDFQGGEVKEDNPISYLN